jgi:hypothetical protein
MPLTKTITVPPGNPEPTLHLPIIKMVVVVNDENIAQTADDLAQMPPIIDRQVVWFPNGLPANFQAEFGVPDLATAVAFSLSPENNIGDVIRQGEIVDDVRMEQAYTSAGL